jgi:hypothetical protein
MIMIMMMEMMIMMPVQMMTINKSPSHGHRDDDDDGYDGIEGFKFQRDATNTSGQATAINGDKLVHYFGAKYHLIYMKQNSRKTLAVDTYR